MKLLRAIFLVSCILAFEKVNAQLPIFKIEPSRFAKVNGCFLLYDLSSEKFVATYGEQRCQQRLPACSTFKVPLALMAFDAGVLKDENTAMKWDGVKRDLEAWNQDQTASTWMKNSVVWYSQKITPQLGLEKISKYLKNFDYGNQDFSAGIDDAWLTVTKSEPKATRGSLAISAYGQIDFMRKFWQGKLGVSPSATQLAKKITFIETSPGGYTLNGKTGSGYPDDLKGDFGWFIGHLEGKGKEYLLVTAITREEKQDSSTYAGPVSRELTKEILKDNGLW